MPMYSDLEPEPLTVSHLAERISLPETEESEGLLSRLWTTKVVSFPGADPAAEERRHDDTDEARGPEDGETLNDKLARLQRGNRPPERIRQGDNSAIRTTALFITSTAIQKMSTEDILQLLSNLLPSRPLGLEWVNDTSVTVLWASDSLVNVAFYELTGEPLPENINDALHFHLIQNVPGVSFEDAFYVRLALGSDVKKKNAASESRYYRENQRERLNRREQSKPYARPERRPKTTDDLDAELEAYIRHGDPDAVGSEPQSDVNPRRRTAKDILDAELDNLTSRREEEL